MRLRTLSTELAGSHHEAGGYAPSVTRLGRPRVCQGAAGQVAFRVPGVPERPKPASSPETLVKYNKSLLAFLRSLERQQMPLAAGVRDPSSGQQLDQGAAGSWTLRGRDRLPTGRGEGVHHKYIYKHLELTTRDLLLKVPRITPPEKPAQPLTEDEIERVIDTFDRNLVRGHPEPGPGGRLHRHGPAASRRVLELPFSSLDRVTGDLTFIRAKGNKERCARLSTERMKHVKAYLGRPRRRAMIRCGSRQTGGRSPTGAPIRSCGGSGSGVASLGCTGTCSATASRSTRCKRALTSARCRRCSGTPPTP